jgi:hypothetical protein
MLGKIRDAVRLLGSNLPLFGAIILTIWLPANFIVEYLALRVFPPGDSWAAFRTRNLISCVFGPIPIAAVLTALARMKAGERPTYRVAMGGGFRYWWRLLAARLIAGLLITLGLVALVVPGIILAVRYFLLDCAVVLEDAAPAVSRARSAALTAGRRWTIFGTAVLFFLALVALGFVLSTGLELTVLADNVLANAVVDCIFDVAFAVLTIVSFLYYWEAREQEHARDAAAAETSGPPLPPQSDGNRG